VLLQDLGAVQAEAAAALLRTLQGLDDMAVMQVCTDAADARTPLVQALASEKARCLVAHDERASWRHNVSGEPDNPQLVVSLLSWSLGPVTALEEQSFATMVALIQWGLEDALAAEEAI